MKKIIIILALLIFVIFSTVSSAQEELCNFIDDDGDGLIDEGLGRGNPCTVGVGECEAEGYIICAENEIDAICNAEPGTPSDEVCDEEDNDCDGEVDEGVCVQEELCNGIDDDNDGDIDEDFDIGRSCYVGRGECRAYGTLICDEDDETDNDCNATAGIPSAEICDGKDNDCDGDIDEDVLITYYKDNDEDGYGNLNDSLTGCRLILRRYVLDNTDCDDTNANINPGKNETCFDNTDNDCDGDIDEDCVLLRTVPENQTENETETAQEPVQMRQDPVVWYERTLPEEQNDTEVQNVTEEPNVITRVTTAVTNVVRNVFSFVGGIFRNPCRGVTCQPSTKTCPDGSEVSCDNTCRKGTCSSCDPVCPINCDDADPCTIDSYNISTARCEHTVKDCNDSDPCTFDSCDRQTGGCSHATLTCNDQNPCTNDMCDRGQCVHMPKDCNDGDPNTDDYCEARTGNCIHALVDKCARMNVSIEGAVINLLSKNMKLFVNYQGDVDQVFNAYLEHFGIIYVSYFNAKANTVTEVTIPEHIIGIYTAGPNPLGDVSKVTVISSECQGVKDSVDKSWILKKSQYCRYADAAIEKAGYENTSGELVLTVNNSGDADLRFIAYIE
ncbi:putative metal-binding motif-containing protein, partial [Candidatus Woesearchaeota archaeon]|nr:putative metal-binding motif-containing protein [Candidatus Woesearchaeota archaeon]